MSNTSDPSQHLKELLNVGKSPADSSSDVKLASNGMKPSRGSLVSDGSGSAQSNGDVSQELPPGLPVVRSNVKQNIVLHGDDSRGSFPLYGQEVIITPSANSNMGNASTSSSQVKCTPVVKYDWESKYYIGNLVAVNKQYVVYVLKLQMGYGVRVLHRQTSERALLKGFAEMIVDLAFSDYKCNVLACVDRLGNLTIWKLFEEDGSVVTKLILSVENDSREPSDYHRVVWGPYLPEDPSSGEPEGNYLGVSHDAQVELWDIDEECMEGLANPVPKEELSNSFIVVAGGHDAAVTDLAVAPDGSVMATASLDGTVKFWAMFWDSSDPPRRLHKFQPHEGKTVSSLLFCDNHKTQDPSVAFWRFLLTGAEFNSEIKLWCTVTWTCLQVVRFLTSDPQPCLKVCLDQSASFLMASDIKRKVFYIIKLFQDTKKGHAHFSSLSEFVLKEPMLNFCVATAGHISSKVVEGDEDEAVDVLSGNSGDEGTSVDDSAAADQSTVLVTMFCVFSKALQKLHVRFEPKSSVENDVGAASVSTTSREDIALQDGLSDLSFSAADQSTDAEGSQPDLIGGISPARPELQPTPAQSMTSSSFTSESNQSTSQPFLMTPDALRSGSFNQKEINALQQLRDSGSSSASSFTQVTRPNMSTVGDLMSPQNSSGGDGSLTVTPSSLQEPSPNSSHVLTPSQVPLPLSAAGSRETSLLAEEIDQAPKSPPNTPEEGNTANLSRLSVASAEDLAERLHQHPRLEKRLSDSSAEVAKILQADMENNDSHDGEEWNEGDRQAGGGSPQVVPNTKPEVSVGDLVDLSYSPVVAPVGVRDSKDQAGDDLMQRMGVGGKELPSADLRDRKNEDESTPGEAGQRKRTSGLPEDGRMPSLDRLPGEAGVSGRTEPETEEIQDTTEMELPVHPKVASMKKGDVETSSATGSDSESGRGDVRKEHRRRKHRNVELESQTLEEVQELRGYLHQVLTASRQQHEEIKKLRTELNKSQQSNSIIQSMKSRIEKLEKNLNTKVDTLVTEQSKAERQRLETVLQDRQRTEKQKQDQMMDTVKTTVKQSVNQSLSKTIQKDVMPEISSSLTGMTNQLSQIATEKLTATDQLMKDNIGKLIKQRGFADSVAQATAQMVSNTVNQSYRDNFYKNVIPAFDNACKNMFQQMAVTFQKGVDNCVRQMQVIYEENAGSQKQEGEVLLAEMRSLVDEQQKNLTIFKEELEKNLQKSLTTHLHSHSERLEGFLADHIQQLITSEIQPVLKQHQDSVHDSIISVVRSQAATPVPTQPDIQRIQNQIREHLARNKINDAFQVALNAADLRALMFACNETGIDKVFGGDECALEQPVLLSLIHQLSHDLTTNTDLKISYLNHCMLAIDEESPVTKGHLTSILEDLVHNVHGFVQSSMCQPQQGKKLRRIIRQAAGLGVRVDN